MIFTRPKISSEIRVNTYPKLMEASLSSTILLVTADHEDDLGHHLIGTCLKKGWANDDAAIYLDRLTPSVPQYTAYWRYDLFTDYPFTIVIKPSSGNFPKLMKEKVSKKIIFALGNSNEGMLRAIPLVNPDSMKKIGIYAETYAECDFEAYDYELELSNAPGVNLNITD